MLVYALDGDAPQYEASRALLKAGRDGSATLYVTLQIVCEFYSIVTNRRRVERPRNATEAIGAISSFLTFLKVLPVQAEAAEILVDLIRRRPVVGGDVFDIQLAAVMITSGIRRIYTFNGSDFVHFAELNVEEPAHG